MTIAGLGGSTVLAKMVSGGAPDGKVLADDGNLYDTVQAAENAASDIIIIGAGTFNESVTVDTAGLTVVGSGYNTLIDGGTSGHAITIAAADVKIKNLSIQTMAGGGNSFDAIKGGSGGDNILISRCWIRNSDRHGINPHDGTSYRSEWIINNVTVEGADSHGILTGPRCIVTECTLIDITSDAIEASGDDTIVSNCVVLNCGKDGIGSVTRSDLIIIGNRVHNSTSDGIVIGSGADCIIANNRVSGSGGQDIKDGGTNNTLDANVTGAAN